MKVTSKVYFSGTPLGMPGSAFQGLRYSHPRHTQGTENLSPAVRKAVNLFKGLGIFWPDRSQEQPTAPQYKRVLDPNLFESHTDALKAGLALMDQINDPVLVETYSTNMSQAAFDQNPGEGLLTFSLGAITERLAALKTMSNAQDIKGLPDDHEVTLLLPRNGKLYLNGNPVIEPQETSSGDKYFAINERNLLGLRYVDLSFKRLFQKLTADLNKLFESISD